MKKNLISVVILALVFANFVLTALLMFSVLPETKKANTLIEKVCSAIDLDLNSGAATGTSNISIDDQEIYKVSEGEDLNNKPCRRKRRKDSLCSTECITCSEQEERQLQEIHTGFPDKSG